MAKHRSAEQVREQHLRDMGPELGAFYNGLTNDITWLHAKWIQYRQLFARSPERINLLNKAGGHFFRVIQDTLFDDVLLHLGRLTDPPRSMGKDNLTLQSLPGLVKDQQLSLEVGNLVKTAVAACDKPRSWRNRRLAHRDPMLAQASPSDPLPGISRAEIEQALGAIRNVVLRLEAHYWKSETAYEHFVSSGGDANSVVHYLHKGIEAQESRLKRLREGKPLPEDLEPYREV